MEYFNISSKSQFWGLLPKKEFPHPGRAGELSTVSVELCSAKGRRATWTFVLRELGPSSLDLQGSPPLDLRSPNGGTLGFYYLVILTNGNCGCTNLFVLFSTCLCFSICVFGSTCEISSYFQGKRILDSVRSNPVFLPLALPC